ncbi:MAG: biotin--[acetyl-CoA-carboxylase] ligase, partial [Bacteroidales bacterium]|nr:biotin--[acetyl-CoA-carboxylase] ligase [Bacteroidales bacterium]
MGLFCSQIITLPDIGSTNAHLIEILSQNTSPLEGTTVRAIHQTRGRGSGDNTWESGPGQNLTFSSVVYPCFLAADRQFLLNKAISLAVSDFVKSILPHQEISVKWPNDIYIGHGKVAGILIHNILKSNTIEASVIGIGLNINQTVFGSHLPNPVSIRMFTLNDLDTGYCLEKLCLCLDKRYRMLKETGIAQINREYLKRLYNFGLKAEYSASGERFSGTIKNVTEFGRLQVYVEGNGL